MLFLQRLVLENFRNYETLDVRFEPGRILLLGDNGQGKTNLLEAVHFLSLLRSFRSTKLEELRRWRQRQFTIRGEFDVSGQPLALGLEYGDKRRLRLDGAAVRRASDFIGRVPAVAFVPEDIELVKGSASGRRRFLDSGLTQVLVPYLNLLQTYDRALRSRNQLLRDAGAVAHAVRAFDRLLAASGARLMEWRGMFLQEFGEFLAPAAHQLLPAGSELTVRYQPAVNLPAGPEKVRAEALFQALDQSWERDRAHGLTHPGPHRDDFGLGLNGKAVGCFGSEGQCRLVALVLRLALAEYLAAKKGAGSVLLLVDDVMGELDGRGRRAFLGALQRAGQVFVAATQPDLLAELAPATAFRVEAGGLTPLAAAAGKTAPAG